MGTLGQWCPLCLRQLRKVLVSVPKEGMLSRCGSDVSLENAMGCLGFLPDGCRFWVLVPLKDSVSYLM